MKCAVWLLLLLLSIAGMSGCSVINYEEEETVEEVREENVLTVALPQELRSLDSTVLSDPRTANTILPLIFDVPVYNNYDGTFSPGLFLTWNSGEGGREWTVTLRQNVRFHNGEAFDAQSVEMTFQYMQEQNSMPFSFYFQELLEVKTVNKYTVIFRFSDPVSSLPELVQHVYLIAPGDFQTLGADGYFAAPSGCGPFLFDSWEENTLILTRNDAWWGAEEGVTNVDQLIFRTISDDSYRISQLTDHEADLICEITAEQMMMLEQKKEIEIYTEESDTICWSGFSCDEGKLFHDRNARLAVWYAVNRRLICDSVLAGGQEWLWPVTQRFIGYDEEAARSVTSYDTYLSRVYLSQCDYDKTPVKIIVESEKLPQCDEVAQFFAVMLEAVGFSADLEIIEPGQWEETWQRGDYDMFISALTISENTVPWQYQYMLTEYNIAYNKDNSEEMSSVYKACLNDVVPFCSWFRIENRVAWLKGVSDFTVNPDQTISFYRVKKAS